MTYLDKDQVLAALIDAIENQPTYDALEIVAALPAIPLDDVAAKLKSIRSWVKSIQEKINASPIALNFRDEIDFCAMRALMNLHDLEIRALPVLETPPADHSREGWAACENPACIATKQAMYPEIFDAPVEPVPTDSEMNLRRDILDVLAANHTSAYDLRSDLYAIFQGVEPVPAPRFA